MEKFRTLRADEIDLRVGTVGDGFYTLLLYKDARCDMNILDETVGAENWQRSHKEVKGNLYCSVGINVNYKQSNLLTFFIKFTMRFNAHRYAF